MKKKEVVIWTFQWKAEHFGFVIPDERTYWWGDFFVHNSNFNWAHDWDRVEAEILENTKWKKPEVKIIDYSFPFENKGSFLGLGETNRFRVPILRNVTKTSPYFHNGSVEKIEEAVDIMAQHQLGIKISATKRDEIVAFLKTLEGEIVDYKLKEYYEGEKKWK